MKVGTSILIIVLILIAFGFVLSDSVHTRQELREVEGKLNGLAMQLDQSQSELGVCQDLRSQDAQSIMELQGQIEELKAENSNLSLQILQNNAEKLVPQTKDNVIKFLTSNPLVLLLVLLARFATTSLRSGKVLGLKIPGWKEKTRDKYVRVSREELSCLIQRRREMPKQRNDF